MQRRQAALQKCGLVPLPRRDLSRLEEELDQRFSHVVDTPQDQQEQGELTTAEKIRREWQAKNEAQPGKQGGNVDPMDPTDVASDPLHPEQLDKSDSTRNAEEQKTLELAVPASTQTLLTPERPVSVYSIPRACLFPDIPEEDTTVSEIEKVHLILVQLSPLADR